MHWELKFNKKYALAEKSKNIFYYICFNIINNKKHHLDQNSRPLWGRKWHVVHEVRDVPDERNTKILHQGTPSHTFKSFQNHYKTKSSPSECQLRDLHGAKSQGLQQNKTFQMSIAAGYCLLFNRQRVRARDRQFVEEHQEFSKRLKEGPSGQQTYAFIGVNRSIGDHLFLHSGE